MKSSDTKTQGHGPLELDMEALKRARSSLSEGAVTPSYGPWREDIVKLLNASLATELVCVLRYRRHHFTAKGIESGPIAAEFMVHAMQEQAHADKIAERIVQLGGSPCFNPDQLTKLSHAEYDESEGIRDMIKANLVAERIAVEAYSQMVKLIGDKDPTTRQMIESILRDEEEHADELADLLER
jgi:bacterioferritin